MPSVEQKTEKKTENNWNGNNNNTNLTNGNQNNRNTARAQLEKAQLVYPPCGKSQKSNYLRKITCTDQDSRWTLPVPARDRTE